MSTCKDCKWWGMAHPREYYDSYPTFGWHKLPCEYDAGDAVGNEYVDDCAVASIDGRNGHYADQIYTGPDFGCVHWEPKA